MRYLVICGLGICSLVFVVLTGVASPEPFVTKCSLELDVLRSVEAHVEIVDRRGELVKTVYRGPLGRGTAAFTWDGRGEEGTFVSPGRYGLRVRSGDHAEIRWITYVQGNE